MSTKASAMVSPSLFTTWKSTCPWPMALRNGGCSCWGPMPAITPTCPAQVAHMPLRIIRNAIVTSVKSDLGSDANEVPVVYDGERPAGKSLCQRQPAAGGTGHIGPVDAGRLRAGAAGELLAGIGRARRCTLGDRPVGTNQRDGCIPGESGFGEGGRCIRFRRRDVVGEQPQDQVGHGRVGDKSAESVPLAMVWNHEKLLRLRGVRIGVNFSVVLPALLPKLCKLH